MPPMLVSAAVEGVVDEAVLRLLLDRAGAGLGRVYGKKGKGHLQSRVTGYNHAAQRFPWIVLVDLDRDFDCPPPLREAWLPAPAPRMCFRVAVRAVEAWLLADAEAIASFLGVSRARIPTVVEGLDDPKRVLVDLARESRRSEIREDLVPRLESGRTVGPAYTSRLVEFVDHRWRPDVAVRASDSLRRSREAIRRLVEARQDDDEAHPPIREPGLSS